MEKKTTRKNRSGFSKYVVSILLFLLFEAVAITLWLTKNNLFYLLNFSYIGCCLSLGTALFTAGKRYARHFVQLAVGCYMLLYLGVFSRENMQIEGFWYYLFLGTFEAATIHYAVAKIFGPLLFGRGWFYFTADRRRRSMPFDVPCWKRLVVPTKRVDWRKRRHSGRWQRPRQSYWPDRCASCRGT